MGWGGVRRSVLKKIVKCSNIKLKFKGYFSYFCCRSPCGNVD